MLYSIIVCSRESLINPTERTCRFWEIIGIQVHVDRNEVEEEHAIVVLVLESDFIFLVVRLTCVRFIPAQNHLGYILAAVANHFRSCGNR